MNFRQKFTLSLLLTIVLGGVVFAQPVHIPDPNLRAAVGNALNGAPITQATMRRLTKLDAVKQGIIDLTGLEHAYNLRELYLWGNPLAELTPIANLERLTYLDIPDCSISDITALSNLVSLTHLNARHNLIVDISPLANLKNLTTSWLSHNRITDLSPLAELTRLEFLEIQHNRIADHSPLDALALSHFIHDQTCEIPPLPLESRLENRGYPSIFLRWGAGISNRPDLPHMENLARHDLWFDMPNFGLTFKDTSNGFKLLGILDEAIKRRDNFLSLNPNMVFIVDIRMREEGGDAAPEGSPFWIRDVNGQRVSDWPGAYLMDFTHPHVQDRIVQQAIAVSKCGLYDGIFFDYWDEHASVLRDHSTWPDGYVGNEAEQHARDNILRRIRAATRPDFLIMGNTGVKTIPRTGPNINGGFMETVVPADQELVDAEMGLSEVEHSLLWLENNIREPRINSLEGWSVPTEVADSPTNLRWMRAFTTLGLTHSDGYVVFTQPETWGHYWYDFWEVDLGRPMGEKGQVYEGRSSEGTASAIEIPGLYIREFTNGWAVYNHSGESQEITLPELVTGVASGVEGTTHTLPNLDGEMYLRVTPKNPADVNGDGIVNILDLTLVAQGFGKDGLQGDVNGDGVVNVFDLVQVAGAIGGGGAAPSAYSLDPSIISAADVARWLAGAQGLGIGDANFQRGIRFLEQLLAALTPKETTLLPNYPNPFNPETWIPYHLARGAEVTITIYDTKGTPVRRLALGNQAAGHYAARGKAAYWDGRNEDGEAVASGIYIYQFRAGDYAASRRMVIVK